MNMEIIRKGNEIISVVTRICGMSFAQAITRGKSALLQDSKKTICLLLQKSVYLSLISEQSF